MKSAKQKKSSKKANEAVNRFDLSTKKGTASEILTTDFERFNSCKTFEDVAALCHELFDGVLDTAWSRKFFFKLDAIKRRNPNPRRAYEQALLYVNNARMRGMGLGASQRFYEGDELNEAMDSKAKKEFMDLLRAGEVKFKYIKKDGTLRKARGTMNPKLMDLPKKKKQADVNKAEHKQKKKRKLPADSVFYYDLESKGFRSFKMANFIENTKPMKQDQN